MKIALFGKMRAGKNCVADILTEEHNFKQFAFGDGIAEIIQKYFPEAWAGGKPRKHYQHIGQQLRVLNPDVWVDYLLRTVEESTHYWGIDIGTNVVVSDGRQLNEAVRLKEQGYLIVKVVTPEEIRIARMKALGDVFTLDQLNHETELQVDLIEADVELINDGNSWDLMLKVQKMLQEHKGGNTHGK